MKTTLFLISFFLVMVRVRSGSEPYQDYFVMTEAHILEYRTTENADARNLPFFMECAYPYTKFDCQPAIPTMNSQEGYVTVKNKWSSIIYYGCPQEINLTDVFNPNGHFQKALIMRDARTELEATRNVIRWYNIYTYRCKSDVSPILWRIGPDQGAILSFGIGFLIPGIQKMPLAEIYYDYNKKIPIWTKHTVYGASLAVPVAPFRSIEEIEYQGDSDDYPADYLERILGNYYEFNNTSGEMRKLFNGTLKSHGLAELPNSSRIVMGHLIPEYDMVMSNWAKIPRFAQTIVPTWEDLYLNEWADVEEMIREVSFMEKLKLTVYSGTHGQLTIDGSTQGEEQKPRFNLSKKKIVFPAVIWKLVIDENEPQSRATVILFHNLTQELTNLKIFTEFKPPCKTICERFQPKNPNEPLKRIYCCKVRELRHKIPELPSKVILNRNFDVLIE